jgi:hypothetical protein
VSEAWVTRDDGRFVARPVSPGRVRALLRHPDYVEALSDAVTLGPGGAAEVRVVMHVGGMLAGRVVDKLGRPIEDVRVRVFASTGSFERSAYSGPDGRFAFVAVPASVTITLARPEESSRTVLQHRVVVPEGERAEVELELPDAREPVRVVVRGERGAAVEAAQVTLLSLDPEVPFRQTRFTREDGSVVFSDAAGLPASLEVEVPGFQRTERSFAALPAELELELEAGVLVQGLVTAVRGRRSVEGAMVTLVSGGQRRSVPSDADGAYSFANVPAGRVTISISHPEYAEGEANLEVRRTTRSDRPFEVPPIDLAEPASVRGRVVDTAGRAVRGARVAVGMVPAFLPAGELPPGVVGTDAEGRFTLSRLAPGRTTLQAYAADVGRGTVELELDAARERADVVITLDQATDRDVTVAGGSVAITLGERGASGSATLIVVQVAPASDAERSGVEVGDVIVEVDGEVVANIAEARERLSGPVGSSVLLTVRRRGTTFALRLTREAVRR